jgi:hypothetical protein
MSINMIWISNWEIIRGEIYLVYNCKYYYFIYLPSARKKSSVVHARSLPKFKDRKNKINNAAVSYGNTNKHEKIIVSHTAT